jgi:hypothetical protein
MQWWELIVWGAFGGAAVEAVEILGAVKKTRQVPWNRPGEVSLSAFATSVAIRVLLGIGLAYALGSTDQVAGPIGAIAVGIAAPLIVEQLTKQIPANVMPVAGGAGGAGGTTPPNPAPPAPLGPAGGGAGPAPTGYGDGTVSGGGGTYPNHGDTGQPSLSAQHPDAGPARDQPASAPEPPPSFAEHPLGTQLRLSLARATESFRANPR